jgi:hypothetical protein
MLRRLLDPLRFAAGVYLLDEKQTDELDQIRARTHNTARYLVEASAYIERTLDAALIEETAEKMLAGKIRIPVMLFVPGKGEHPKR